MTRARARVFAWTGIVFMLAVLVLPLFALSACSTPDAPAVPELVTKAQAVEFDAAPPQARKHRASLTREGRVVWGLTAPIAMFAGQIEQESGWNESARSPVGAGGLAQFMESTARDFPDEQGRVDVYDPEWAIRSLVRYDKQLFDRMSGASPCDRHAFSLSAYNGGAKWVERDQQKAALSGLDSMRYFENVERVNAGRNQSAWTENRNYVPGILKRQPKYRYWGATVCDERVLG